MSKGQEKLIVSRGITKEFRTPDGKSKNVVLSDVSLEVAPNEFVAIVGSSGSGKSTLLYCLSGLQKVSGGTVEFLGDTFKYVGETVDLTKKQSSGVGFVFQNYQLLAFLTVKENILLPAKYSGDVSGAMKRLPALLERLGLADKINSRVSELSGGQQQRVSIARALINEPSIIFADEPTGALDTKNPREVMEILKDIPNENRSVLMVTHDLGMASQASRVLVLSDGKIVSQLGPSTQAEILAALNQAKQVEKQG